MVVNRAELVFLLDKSGSMGGLESDTIGGFNAMLKTQQEVLQSCRITTVLFNNNYELLHDRLDLQGILPITEKEYIVGGTTALLDAIGKTIKKISDVQAHSQVNYKPNKVLFVITTDGLENASRDYSYSDVKTMIERQKELGWEFIFLGANIDAVEVAHQFGIKQNRAQNYHADGEGTEIMFKSIAEVGIRFSIDPCGEVPDDWNAVLNKDYSNRKPCKKAGEV
jgi:uncharacterized protein YegL